MSNHSNQVSTATRLAAQTPDQVNSLVVSLAQQFEVRLDQAATMRGGAELPDGSRTPVTYEWHWVAKGVTSEQALAAAERVEGSLTRATQAQIAGWIAELSVISARRADDQMTDDLRLAAYSRRLADYPADIARYALLEHRWKFFPTWAELAEVCDKQRDQRLSMIAAIRREADRLRRLEEDARSLPDEGGAVKTLDERIAERKAVAESMEDIIRSMREKAEAERARGNIHLKGDA